MYMRSNNLKKYFTKIGCEINSSSSRQKKKIVLVDKLFSMDKNIGECQHNYFQEKCNCFLKYWTHMGKWKE